MDYNRIIEKAAKKYGKRVIKILPDRDMTLNYEDIESYSMALACWLLDRGLKKGDCFAIWMGNVPEFLFLMGASLRIGTVIVPISIYEKADTVEEICRESGCQFLIYDGQNKFVRQQSACMDFPCPSLDISAYRGRNNLCLDFLGDELPRRELHCELSPTDDILIAYTSGSTGEKKGIRKSISSYFGKKDFPRFFVFSMDLLQYIFPLRLYNLSPWYHNTGTTLLMVALSGGIHLEIVTERFNPAKAYENLKAYKPKLWLGTATMLYRCCTVKDDPSLRLPAVIVSTGEALPGHIVSKLETFPGGAFLYAGYGTTETGPISNFVYRFRKAPMGLRFLMFLVEKLGVIGKIYDMDALGPDEQGAFLGKISSKIEVLIVDPETQQPLPDGHTGEICVHSSMQMNGYLKDRQSAVYLHHGGTTYLRTGDLGYKRGDGLYMAGRKKNIIIRSGENILPSEIEAVAQECPGVSAAVVCGLPCATYGESVCLCLEADQQTFDLTGLQTELKERLPKYMYPQTILFWDQFPLNSSGKTDVLQIRKEAAQRSGQE